MLDLVLRDVTFRHRDGFALAGISLSIDGSTHLALTGPAGCGTSTIARLIAGELRPESGEILIGPHVVNTIRKERRPLLFVDSRIDVAGRWSVEHALVAAVRTRKLDRIDRRRELLLAVEQWGLGDHLPRRIDSLSATESTRVHLARIELLRPALLVADRLLERVSPSARVALADQLFRTLRVHGTTVVSIPSAHNELAFSDQVAVIDGGLVAQKGYVTEIHRQPLTRSAAEATGECDAIPIEIHGTRVDSAIGSWPVDPPPFQGSGVAIVRPSHFQAAARGEESDFIFGVEEAGVSEGRWVARGLVSGGISLRVELPLEADVHKGRLFPLRYDPRQFLLLARAGEERRSYVPTDVVPPMSESR